MTHPSTTHAGSARAQSAAAGESRFRHSTYLVRRKVLKIFGGAFHIYDASENLLFFSELKAFKLKEDIRLYESDAKRQELLTIRARQVIDFGATYDVVDPAAGKVGALRRKGLKSILKDEWLVLDAGDREVGKITEDSTLLALVRRFLTNLVPQKFRAEVRGQRVGSFKQRFNPFVLKLEVDLSGNTAGALDPRLAIAAAILLCAIEGRQHG